jgi:hypothetical protein
MNEEKKNQKYPFTLMNETTKFDEICENFAKLKGGMF